MLQGLLVILLVLLVMLLEIQLMLGLHMGKKTKCDTATLKVVEVRRGLL